MPIPARCPCEKQCPECEFQEYPWKDIPKLEHIPVCRYDGIDEVLSTKNSQTKEAVTSALKLCENLSVTLNNAYNFSGVGELENHYTRKNGQSLTSEEIKLHKLISKFDYKKGELILSLPLTDESRQTEMFSCFDALAEVLRMLKNDPKE